MAMPKITDNGLVPGTTRDIYVRWSWDKENTSHYEVTVWYILEGIDGWVRAHESYQTVKGQTFYQYTAPENATTVKLKVRPVAKTHKVNNADVAYWTAEWSELVLYYFKSNPPSIPPVPSIELDSDVYSLTFTIEGIAEDTTQIEYELIENDAKKRKGGKVDVAYGRVSHVLNVSDDCRYKVRCRAWRDGLSSEWSDYSQTVYTKPGKPAKIDEIKATSSTSVYLTWAMSLTAETYDLEIAKKKSYFGTDKAEIVSGIDSILYEKIGMESGSEYFFRVRAVNSHGVSAWSPYVSIIIGKPAAAPTTWSSTTTAIVGDRVTLYWTHNTEDNSRQRYAEIELTTGSTTETKLLDDTSNDESEYIDDVTHYVIDASSYKEGAELRWRVRTKGILDEWSDWSIQRTIDIYERPRLQLDVTNMSGEYLTTLTQYPIRVNATAYGNLQTPIGYHLSIIANETYESVNPIGNRYIVNKGTEVYSRYFDSVKIQTDLRPEHVHLDNGISYTIACIVTMDSGLNATDSSEFVVGWHDFGLEPDAEIGIDRDTYSAYIRPYCVNSSGNRATDVTLAVYRREYDGKFTSIASGLANNGTFVADPHPALDYARYRIVATHTGTGAISYYDPPGYPVGGRFAIIQWDEDWIDFNATEDGMVTEQPWSGSLLELRYNLDISDKTKTDVVFVEYIGREHPVDYYGTQLGQTSSWSMVIPKEDVETLYALRRLSVWMGKVYVREPSGTGYWANVEVSYNIKHRDVVIPITLNITRVEGGV